MSTIEERALDLATMLEYRYHMTYSTYGKSSLREDLANCIRAERRAAFERAAEIAKSFAEGRYVDESLRHINRASIIAAAILAEIEKD